jgi:hypothetical protein
VADKQSEIGTSPCDSPHSLYESEPAYSPDFMNFDFNDIEGFDTFIKTPLEEMFPVSEKNDIC